MKSIGIVTRPNDNQWGGDLKALYTIRDGLQSIGHQVNVAGDVKHLLGNDIVLLSNTCLDQTQAHHLLKKNNKQYSIIGFHEDFIKYFGVSMGFTQYISNMLLDQKDGAFNFELERLLESPEIVRYYSSLPVKSTLFNYDVLRDARTCIANSEQEKNTMLRDCSTCNAQVVKWSPGFADEWSDEIDDQFLKDFNLQHKQFILQVGRFETRKNQLATILATRDIDIPVVFVATKGYQPWYDKLVAMCIKKYRKHRTLIISDYLHTQTINNVEIYNTKEMYNDKLPTAMLKSAFHHATVNAHPAFYELPGYTYLEAASVDTVSVAGEWCSINDYELKDLINPCSAYDINSIQRSIEFCINNKHQTKSQDVSLLSRTKTDVAEDIIKLI